MAQAVGVYAVFVSERLTLGTLISGALATRIGLVAGRLVPPSSEGVGTTVSGVGLVRTHCWVLRKRTMFGAAAGWWWPWCLPRVRGGCLFCLVRGRPPVRPVHSCACFVCGGGCWWRGGFGRCLLFEICIVDASIFVAKFFRAHGGCLGIRSR